MSAAAILTRRDSHTHTHPAAADMHATTHANPLYDDDASASLPNASASPTDATVAAAAVTVPLHSHESQPQCPCQCQCPRSVELLQSQRAKLDSHRAHIAAWKKSYRAYEAFHANAIAKQQQEHALELERVRSEARRETSQLSQRLAQLEQSEQQLIAQVRQLQAAKSLYIDTTVDDDTESSLDLSTMETASPSSSTEALSLSTLVSPDSPQQRTTSLQLCKASTSQQLVADHGSTAVSTHTFPRALTKEDNASVGEHVTNLFAQVAALKEQLAKKRAAAAEQAKAQHIAVTQPQIVQSTATIVDVEGEQPLQQEAHSQTESVASIEKSVDTGLSVLTLSTTTKTHVRTSSVADGATSFRSSVSEDSADSAASASPSLSSVSQHISTLSQSSGSMDAFVRQLSSQVGEYHQTIHRLRAQVEHLQAQLARADTEASQRSEQQARKYEEQVITHSAKMAELQAELLARDTRLAEVQSLLSAFSQQMRDIQRDLSLPSSASQDAASSDSTSAAHTTMHFFATLHGYLSELRARQHSQCEALRSLEQANTQLAAHLRAAHANELRLEAEQKHGIKLQEQINMLQMVLDTERKQYARATLSCTVLPSFSSSASIVIPHLPLHTLQKQESSSPSVSECEEKHSGSQPRSRAPAPVRSYLANPPPSVHDPSAPSTGASSVAGSRSPASRSEWAAAVERASESSLAECASGHAFGVRSPSSEAARRQSQSAFQLLARTPFTSTLVQRHTNQMQTQHAAAVKRTASSFSF